MKHLVLASVLALLMAPVVVQASFNGTPCGSFDCHFTTLGILLGLMGGLPVSALIFIALHMGLAHPARSRDRQLYLGGMAGVLAYEIAAAVGAWHAASQLEPGQRGGSPFEAFLICYAVLAVLAVLYVRSAPRPPVPER
ncbi:MAG TPA: hypothetical protein VFV27_03590 [Nevskiaceae bacterium]|nr:hypothetical protein [Nevskiaceae bacterium]